MAVPVTITFHRLTPVAWIEEDLRTRAAKLRRYCRLLRICRVVVDIPHRHRLQGNRFRLQIELTVPDDSIMVTREGALSVRRDPARAIREAFVVARRRLRDYSRRQRRAAKRHSLPTGRPGARTANGAARDSSAASADRRSS